MIFMKLKTTKTSMQAPGMLAGEAAKLLGVGVQTLHFYEQQKLIPPPLRSGSGYRLYTPRFIERVRFIRKAQALNFSLDEVREILSLTEQGTSPCGRVQARLAEKLHEVDRRLMELQGFRDELVALVAASGELSTHEAQVCQVEVPVEKVHPGEVIVIRPGERVLLDGIIQQGSSSFDLSSVTGESKPVYREAGGEVVEGTINLDGFIRVRVTRPASESFVSQVVKLMRQIEERSRPYSS